MRDNIEQGQYHEGSVCFVKEFGLYLKPEKAKENVSAEMWYYQFCVFKNLTGNSKGRLVVPTLSERG